MDIKEITIEATGDAAKRDLIASMALIGLIIVLALSQLAWDGNWQKFLRVSVAFFIYASVLLSSVRWVGRAADIAYSFWLFAMAAGTAEIASGWLRPDWKLSDTLTLPLAAALLIGGVHWLALRAWRPLRERISASG